MVWFPRGPALDRYSNTIRPEVEGILNNIELPEGEKLIVKLYMIGRSEQKANPIIMVCCSDKTTRKEAEALIRESGLLDQDGNCGFGLGSTGFPLEANFLPRPLGKDASTDNAQLTDALKVDVYGLTQPGIGRKLGFIGSSQAGRTVKYTTGGPIIHIGDHLYQLTVAHAMRQSFGSKTPRAQGLDLDECEFDGQPDEEDDSHLALSIGSLSPGDSMTGHVEPDSDEPSQQSSSSSDSCPETPTMPIQGNQESGEPLTPLESGAGQEEDGLWKSSVLLGSISMPDGPGGELDYLLIKLPTEGSELVRQTNQITIDEPVGSRNIRVDDIASVKNEEVSVLVITSRGPIRGHILSDPISCKTRGPSSFQHLLAILLSKGMKEGDSGSAVIDSHTGHFYGHVILGVEGDCAAYVLPSPNMMANITAQFQQLPAFHRGTPSLIRSTTPSVPPDDSKPTEIVSVPVNDLLGLQRELVEARSTVNRLNTALRDKGSKLKSIIPETLLDPILLMDMQTATTDRKFQDELNYIDQWFRGVNAGQQSVALHTLLQKLDPAQMDVINRLLHRRGSIAPLSELMGTIPATGSNEGEVPSHIRRSRN